MSMLPRVTDVLALPVIQQGDPQVLSDAGLDRQIRWVHVSDLPDLTDLLQGGELVLTTGAELRRSPAIYLRRLASAGAVGVVVELPGRLPPATADLAAAEGLALIVLRRQVRFVAVTEEVHRQIVAVQYQEVAFARRVHEQFTALTLRRAGPAEIVDSCAELLGVPVILEDLSHQAVATGSAGRDVSAVLDRWEHRSRLHAARRDAAGHDMAGPGTAGHHGTGSWTVEPVGRGAWEWARLVAVDATGPERTTVVLERAAQALAMHRMAERDQVDLVRQAQAGLIEDVLAGRLTGEPQVLARAQALGMLPGRRYVPAAALVAPPGPGADPLAAQQHQAALLDTITKAVRGSGHTGLFSLRPDATVAMVLTLGPGSRDETAMLADLGHALRRDVAHVLGAPDLVLGVGTGSASITTAIEQIDQAAHVAQTARSMPGRTRATVEVGDIRLRGLIAQLRDDPRVRRFAESELRELLLADLATGADDVGLLRGYLEASGNKTALARRLGISRPALYTRLDRIARVLGVDLDDGESRTCLHVAVLILQAAQQGNPQAPEIPPRPLAQRVGGRT